MVGLKAKAREHSLNSLPATTNGIQFNRQLSADNTTKVLNMDAFLEKHSGFPYILLDTGHKYIHIHTVELTVQSTRTEQYNLYE